MKPHSDSDEPRRTLSVECFVTLSDGRRQVPPVGPDPHKARRKYSPYLGILNKQFDSEIDPYQKRPNRYQSAPIAVALVHRNVICLRIGVIEYKGAYFSNRESKLEII